MQKSKNLLIVFVLLASQLRGQPNKILFDKMSAIDSVLFSAFNNCDVDKYGSFLADDYEFYHDKQGMIKSREAELESMTIFCGEQRKRQHLRRELVTESLQVFPMNEYGAVVTGEHKFYLVINELTSKPVTKAKFTTLWKCEDTEWKMTRTLSYDHQPLAELQLDEETLMLYEGNYQADDRIVKIKKEGVILRMIDLVDNKEVWSAELLLESTNLFYLNFQNIQVEFISVSKEIQKLIIYENGTQMEEANKVK